jgi:hypothetical protein
VIEPIADSLPAALRFALQNGILFFSVDLGGFLRENLALDRTARSAAASIEELRTQMCYCDGVGSRDGKRKGPVTPAMPPGPEAIRL